ncbi:MAG: hypothetical protein ACOYMA_17360 [Bacteroidia bacterium]
MTKKDIYILAIIIILNVLIYSLVLPYAQKTANNHMNIGPFLGAILYVFAVLLTFIGLIDCVKQKDFKLFLWIFVFALTLTFWGYRLNSLVCLGCLNSG